MTKTIEAIYENGVLIPVNPLDLKEHEKVRIILKDRESAVRTSSGMIRGLDEAIINEIALSPEFMPEEA